MRHLAGLIDELERSAPAQAAMAMLETALARRTVDEQGAFWRAVDIYYVSRKAPPEAIPVPANADPAGTGEATAGIS